METYIKDLFRYIETYEQKYAEFDSEAFFQTYNGIYAVFHALREQRDQAVQVDNYFLKKIKSVPINSSDLRQIALQILIHFSSRKLTPMAKPTSHITIFEACVRQDRTCLFSPTTWSQ